MYYNVREGMHHTWSDRFGLITRVTAHNWLPTAVGSVVVLWISLIIVALQQTGPANPGKPSDLSATKSSPPMAVTTATPTSGDHKTPDSDSTTAKAAILPAATTPFAPTAAPLASGTGMQPYTATNPAIGGRGADEQPLPSTLPVVPIPPEVDPSLSLSIDTPLTSDPITLNTGTNDGLQLDTGLGL